ncbi:beta-lactamase/transpeptidase-like protein [Dendryphion nanum]|uniref:Beta-lactamase/transpeptidase-like protein n=1 Tax=Dendryphion nanum TaxID=256645 RepID=A0A9P9EK08_9PLEO|nr:beta-lactamase/transpeptidase-like protein [Dendryphion nanum]
MSSTLRSQIDSTTSSSPPTQLAIVLLAWSATSSNSPQELISHTSGHTHLDEKKSHPVTLDSIFRLASCTKLITSLAALRLVQAGKLSLDDSEIISTHLPELVVQEVFTSAPGEPFTYKKRKNPITLRALLTHSSGSGIDLIDERLKAWRKARGERSLTLTGPVAEAHSVPLLFEPGEGWVYGGGLDWAGLLVERVSGIRFGEFLRKEIFDIVGCDERIGFMGDLRSAGISEEDIVQTVTRKGDGSGSLKAWPTVSSKAELGGGGLLASSRNFGKVLRDLIAGESRLLERRWIDALFEPQFEEGGMAVLALRKSVPVFRQMTGPLTDSITPEGVNHGLGGMVIREDSEVLGKTTGTMTWGGAFSCMWFVNREQGVAAYYASNVFPPMDPPTSKLTNEFIKEVWTKAGKDRVNS